MELSFLTTSAIKFQVAGNTLAPYGITLRQEALETPELQSLDVEEVAVFSANHMQEKLKRPFLLTDAGFHLTALNGFPGALGKFLNTVSAHDILNLMSVHTNREVIFRECLAYSAPGQPVQTFISEQKATLAHQPQGQGTPINTLVILQSGQPLGLMDEQASIAFWQNTLTHYHSFAKFFKATQAQAS